MNKPFAGVPTGRVQVTPLPNVLFSEVLPELTDLAEAQITLHIFYLLYHKKGSPRYVTFSELRGDPTLHRALAHAGAFDEALERGLAEAEARGTLLKLVRPGDAWYFFNTAESRRAVERIERGELLPGSALRRPEPGPAPRPNIFTLYEQSIGPLTPMVAEELKAAAEDYPAAIIQDAFRIAAENNVRKWSYVRAILSDWTREGKNEASGRDSQKPKSRAKRGPHFQGESFERFKRKRK